MEFLRVLASIPLLIADAIWARLTRDELEELIEHHRQMFYRQHEGE